MTWCKSRWGSKGWFESSSVIEVWGDERRFNSVKGHWEAKIRQCSVVSEYVVKAVPQMQDDLYLNGRETLGGSSPPQIIFVRLVKGGEIISSIVSVQIGRRLED